ncbi:MAG: hypothetical protein H0W02_23060 [Ktedonobacteraceae bacterium]|nr:hypothetical protein [Ktedonobacteraceae bacterium]
MGTVIHIQEQTAKDDGFQATVSFDSGPHYTITVSNPFDGEQEEELAWDTDILATGHCCIRDWCVECVFLGREPIVSPYIAATRG